MVLSLKENAAETIPASFGMFHETDGEIFSGFGGAFVYVTMNRSVPKFPTTSYLIFSIQIFIEKSPDKRQSPRVSRSHG
jgi:hypothetical protein